MTETTVLRGAAWVVGWNQAAERHEYLRDVDLVFSGNTIDSIKKGYAGPFHHELEAANRLVIPGLVNIHTHPASEPLRKGITDETRSPGFHHSSLYEFLTVFDNDTAGRAAALQVAVCELLMSGCTTFTDLSMPYEGWLDVLGETGIRAVAAPGFRDACWLTRNGHSLEYKWDRAAGRAGLDEAIRLIDLAGQHRSGRLSGMVYPAQLDTCSRSYYVTPSIMHARKIYRGRSRQRRAWPSSRSYSVDTVAPRWVGWTSLGCSAGKPYWDTPYFSIITPGYTGLPARIYRTWASEVCRWLIVQPYLPVVA